MVKYFNRSFIDNSIKVLFLNLFLFPIYPDNVKPSLLALFCLFSFIFFLKKDKVFFCKKYISVFAINCIPFIVVLVSLFYSKNIIYGKLLLLRLVPLFIFPLSFYFLKSNTNIFNHKFLLISKLLFYLSVFVFFVAIFFYFLFKGYVTENYFLNYSHRIISQLGKFSIHPIYASIYTSIALIFSISLFRLKKIKIYVIIGNIFLVINLLLLSRKSAIFIIVILILLYLFYNRKINIKTKFLTFISIFILAVSVYNFVPDISNRFKDLTSFINESNNKSSSNLRLNIYKTVIPLIKQKPILGYGLGFGENILFQSEKLNSFFNGKTYNSHNQYLGFALNTGLIGLAFFMFFIFKNLTIVFKNSFEHTFVIIFFLLLMLVENILDRQNGIMFFSLFINYFAFYAVINEK